MRSPAHLVPLGELEVIPCKAKAPRARAPGWQSDVCLFSDFAGAPENRSEQEHGHPW